VTDAKVWDAPRIGRQAGMQIETACYQRVVLEADYLALRAENEHLRDSCALDSEGRPLTICHKLATARAEVERLRVALTLVRDTQGGRYGWPWDHVEAHVNAALGLVRPIPSAGSAL